MESGRVTIQRRMVSHELDHTSKDDDRESLVLSYEVDEASTDDFR